MKNKIFLTLFCLLFTSHLIAAEYAPNEILIKTKQGITVQSNSTTNTLTPPQTLLKKYNIKSAKPLLKKHQKPTSPFTLKSANKNNTFLENTPLFVLEVENPDTLLDTIEQLNNEPDVIHAQPNYIYHLFETPNDELFPTNQTEFDLFYAEDAWDITTGNSNVVIAVIDSGINLTHEDLYTQLWINDDSSTDDTDNDNNGFEDDIYGWDFVNNDNSPADDNGHGTHVSGIAAAKINNEAGVAGVCPGCRIMPIKAASSSGDLYVDDIINAIEYAVDNGADVINASFGARFNKSIDQQLAADQLLEAAVTQSIATGIYFVAAAGNDLINIETYNVVPANYPGVITISSSTDQGVWDSNYSNYGDPVDFMMPGSTINSTYIPSSTSYAYLSGTSMAAPAAAGAIGLLLSALPSPTTTNVYNRMSQTATDVHASGKDSLSGYGIINIPAAILLNEAVPTITHTALTTANYGFATTVTMTVTDNLVGDTLDAYIYAEAINTDNPTTLTYSAYRMSNENSLFTGSIPKVTNTEKTHILYYLQVTDAAGNVVTYPEDASSNVISLTLSDITAPTIEFPNNLSNDYLTQEGTLDITVTDNFLINENSITVAISDSSTTYNYAVTTDSSILDYDNSTLTIDFSTIDLNTNDSVIITVYAEDVTGNANEDSITLKTSSRLTLYGPNGPGSPVVNVPNPFDPRDEETYFWYQSSTDASLSIDIYTLDLQKVKTIDRTIFAGPTDKQDIWDGRDLGGDLVPNGTYIAIIKATANGETVIKRVKIAVLRD